LKNLRREISSSHNRREELHLAALTSLSERGNFLSVTLPAMMRYILKSSGMTSRKLSPMCPLPRRKKRKLMNLKFSSLKIKCRPRKFRKKFPLTR
jgi:hypothetical protein